MPVRIASTFHQDGVPGSAILTKTIAQLESQLSSHPKRILVLHLINPELDHPTELTYHKLSVEVSRYKPDHIVCLNTIEPHWMVDLNRIINTIIRDIPYTLMGCYKNAPSVYFDFCSTWTATLFQKYTDEELLPVESDKFFLTHNRNPYPHRQRFVADITFHDLLDSGFVSLGSFKGENLLIEENLRPDQNYFNERQANINQIPQDTDSVGDLSVWQRQVLVVMSDSYWEKGTGKFGKMYMSEKFYKPILGLRPILLYTNPDNYMTFRDNGFDTFEDVFGLSIEDMTTSEELARSSIIKALLQLKAMTATQRLDWYNALLPRLLNNRRHFYDYVNQQFKTLEDFRCQHVV
jgi:hypothetical protein